MLGSDCFKVVCLHVLNTLSAILNHSVYIFLCTMPRDVRAGQFVSSVLKWKQKVWRP